MTDKERLEEIINRRPARWGNLTVKEFERDIKILQQQAERVEELEKKLSINTNNMKQLQKENERYKQRVEELEKEKDEWKDTAQSYYMMNQELREQNKHYRKVINNIIEKTILFGTNEEAYEAIQDAIKALEGEKWRTRNV